MKLETLYERTLTNCKYYENENKKMSLLNEIGVLRGIAYCLEAKGKKFFYNDMDFIHFIKIQQELKELDNE